MALTLATLQVNDEPESDLYDQFNNPCDGASSAGGSDVGDALIEELTEADRIWPSAATIEKAKAAKTVIPNAVCPRWCRSKRGACPDFLKGQCPCGGKEAHPPKYLGISRQTCRYQNFQGGCTKPRHKCPFRHPTKMCPSKTGCRNKYRCGRIHVKLVRGAQSRPAVQPCTAPCHQHARAANAAENAVEAENRLLEAMLRNRQLKKELGMS